ncbi:hypothetical protein CRUP_031989 [Coryphaenoides rupestris]|nr:hypothetical protein CRUP_031989 [Coryphaenoides rupestris]
MTRWEVYLMASLSEQLHKVRMEAELCLYSGGSVVEVRAGVNTMANLPLPPCSKYCLISAETMVIENSFGSNRKQRLSTALNILEKYGCNLTNPNRPKYWRTVKHNNPVFRATVDAIQGGRDVLCLYGYSNQQLDGLSFPLDVVEPDVGQVARVTLEVMSLRMELDMLIKDTQEGRQGRSLSAVKHGPRSSTWHCHHCTKVNSIRDVLCETCERPRLASSSTATEESQPTTITEWQCKSCTMVNAASSILCEVCERPRLATRPPVTPTHPAVTPPRPPAPVLGMPGDPDNQWVCQFCTYLNYSPSTVCEICDLALKLRPPSPVRRVPALPVKPKNPPTEDPEHRRQRQLQEEGLRLIQLIRATAAACDAPGPSSCSCRCLRCSGSSVGGFLGLTGRAGTRRTGDGGRSLTGMGAGSGRARSQISQTVEGE